MSAITDPEQQTEYPLQLLLNLWRMGGQAARLYVSAFQASIYYPEQSREAVDKGAEILRNITVTWDQAANLWRAVLNPEIDVRTGRVNYVDIRSAKHFLDVSSPWIPLSRLETFRMKDYSRKRIRELVVRAKKRYGDDLQRWMKEPPALAGD